MMATKEYENNILILTLILVWQFLSNIPKIALFLCIIPYSLYIFPNNTCLFGFAVHLFTYYVINKGEGGRLQMITPHVIVTNTTTVKMISRGREGGWNWSEIYCVICEQSQRGWGDLPISCKLPTTNSNQLTPSIPSQSRSAWLHHEALPAKADLPGCSRRCGPRRAGETRWETFWWHEDHAHPPLWLPTRPIHWLPR